MTVGGRRYQSTRRHGRLLVAGGRSGNLSPGCVERHRVLIVEDDERIGSSLLRALVGSGYDAVWERTGEGGLDPVVGRRPDLVLLDLGLPDVDGIEVCGRIHEVDPSIDVVMLTARDEELDVVVGLDAGAVDYVAKPFKLAELLARIRAQLRRRVPGHDAQLLADAARVP